MERRVDKRNQLESQKLNQQLMMILIHLVMNQLNLLLNQLMMILIHLLMMILLLLQRRKPLNPKRKKRRKLLLSQLLSLTLKFMKKTLILKPLLRESLKLPLMDLFGTKITKFSQLLTPLRNFKSELSLKTRKSVLTIFSNLLKVGKMFNQQTSYLSKKYDSIQTT
jgi:hypothetical protein